MSNSSTTTFCDQGYLHRLSLAIFCALTALTAWDFNQSALASPQPEAPTQSISEGASDVVPALHPPLKPVSANAPSQESGKPNFQGDQSNCDRGQIALPSDRHLGQSAKGDRFSPMEKLHQPDGTVESIGQVPCQGTSVHEPETLGKAATEILVEKIVESGEAAISIPDRDSYRTAPATLDTISPIGWKPGATNTLAPYAGYRKRGYTNRIWYENSPTISPVNRTVEAVPYSGEETPLAEPNPVIPISRSASDLLSPEPLQAQGSVPANPDSSPTNPLPVPDTQPSDSADSADNAEGSADELGEIRTIRPLTPKPDLQLLLRSSVLTSSELGTSATSFGSFGLINGAFLLAIPKLGPETRLVASAGGSLVRGTTVRYELLNFNLAVRQRLAPGTYGQLGWVQEQIYQRGIQELFDNSIQLKVDRQDQLAENLRLNSSYELRVSFAEPEESSRVTNALGVRLRYDITPLLEGALDYRIVFDNFTARERFDIRQQVSALAIYRFTPQVFISGSVSYVFGSVFSVVSSTEDLNNLVLGVSLGLNLL